MKPATAPLRLAPGPRGPERIRVQYVIDSLRHGGAERLLLTYLERLPSLGVDPVVTVMQERDGNPLADPIAATGAPVETLHIERLRQRGAYAAVADAIDRARPDVVHTQLEFANILATLAARRAGIATIATLHTLDAPRRWSRDAARERVMNWALRRRSDRVLAVSRSAAEHFARRSRAGRVGTLHNGIDLRPFPAPASARTEVRDQLGIDPHAPVAVTVAVLRPPKGIGDMISALPAVLAQSPRLRYVVVGDGEDESRLRRLAEDLGVERSLVFTGYRDDIPAVLAAGDLFVLPSHIEALPTVLIEAMAAGLPIVTTDVGGIPEMVDPGSSALLVPGKDPGSLADAVNRVLGSPLQAAAMGKNGRRIATERFDVDRQARRLVEEYRHLVRSMP